MITFEFEFWCHCILHEHNKGIRNIRRKITGRIFSLRNLLQCESRVKQTSYRKHNFSKKADEHVHDKRTIIDGGGPHHEINQRHQKTIKKYIYEVGYIIIRQHVIKIQAGNRLKTTSQPQC